jgi:hypothetical protein
MRKITTKTGRELTVPERGERIPGAGRSKGTRNKLTVTLKEAILKAGELVGDELQAKVPEEEHIHGLIAYLMEQARTNPDVFMAMLGRVLPLQINTKHEIPEPVVYRTVEEVRAALIEKGIPADKIDMLLE